MQEYPDESDDWKNDKKYKVCLAIAYGKVLLHLVDVGSDIYYYFFVPRVDDGVVGGLLLISIVFPLLCTMIIGYLLILMM